MKKRFSALLLAWLLCSLSLLEGCGLFDALSDKVPTTYPNAEKYTVGNAEFDGKVDSLSIWWIYGSVTVKTHKESTVKIEETANRALDDTLRLHWRYFNASDYGDVLYVRYSASGNFDYGDLQKDITVYLPEQDGMDISLTVEAASVDVDVSTFENTLDELTVITNSGKVTARIDSADEVRISGQNDEDVPEQMREFFLRANGTVQNLGVSSSYAKVDVAASSVRSGEVGSVFADLCFSAEKVEELKLYNSRNGIYATVLSFNDLEIENFEGECELTLSPDASFVLTVKEKDRFKHPTVPTSVTVGFADATHSGAQYTVGSGENAISVATAGAFSVLPLAQAD